LPRVFADTFHWIVLIDPQDAWHDEARAMAGTQVDIVTSDEVLTEVLAFFAGQGPYLRAAAAQFVQTILSHVTIEALPQSRDSFLSGFELYSQRPDKTYSLTDCIGMQIMRSLGISEVLTHDHHFAQEGFVPLFR
jgi:uncharacterized protein